VSLPQTLMGLVSVCTGREYGLRCINVVLMKKEDIFKENRRGVVATDVDAEITGAALCRRRWT
jgi:hypothetical protein